MPGRQPGEQPARILIGAVPDHRDGRELVVLGCVGLEQDDRGARLVERPLDARVGFLGERRIERRQRVRVARLEHRLRGLVALGRIGGEQGQATERRLDRAAQPIVEPHRAEIGGRSRRGLAGRGIEDRAGLVADEDLVAA